MQNVIDAPVYNMTYILRRTILDLPVPVWIFNNTSFARVIRTTDETLLLVSSHNDNNLLAIYYIKSKRLRDQQHSSLL